MRERRSRPETIRGSLAIYRNRDFEEGQVPNNLLLSQMINQIVNETSACMSINVLRYISDTPVKFYTELGQNVYLEI